MEKPRGSRRLWLVLACGAALFGAALAGIGSGLAQQSAPSGTVPAAERGIRFGVAPDGTRIALSPAIDPSSLRFLKQGEGRYVSLATGVGPAAGMTCVVVARATHSNTACDTPPNIAKTGLIISGETPRGTLDVTGYMPGAEVDAPKEGRVLLSGDDVFAVEVPHDQALLAIRLNGVGAKVPVPGGGSERLVP